MNRFLRGLLLPALLLSLLPAHAAVDNIFLGNGSSGAITVNSANTVINTYSRLTANAPAGQNFISIASSTGFAVGDLVMVWQTGGYTASSSLSAASDLTAVTTGRWEFCRINALTATRLTFSSPLTMPYALSGAQVVRVPQYTNVTINASGSIVPQAWNGTSGGIVVFLATGTVTNNGSINANATGFRGGVSASSPTATPGSAAVDLAPPAAGQKGEGIAHARYGVTSTGGGRGSVANGGGGGVSYQSGGGGGGNQGQGGIGGRADGNTDLSRAVGGYGGGQLIYDATGYLVLGGGGGAGYNYNGTGADAGAGGGVVFFRANTLAGTGTISANGAPAATVTQDAGGGGGAGGSIYVRLVGAAACGAFSASGGNGGSTGADMFGPGGGGGGGSILFQSGSGACSPTVANVSGGILGTQPVAAAPDGPGYGAASGTAGSVTLLPGAMPTAVSAVVTAPATGDVTVFRPRISGTATPNATVSITIDGTTTYTTTADTGGNYAYQLTAAQALSNGSHTVRVTPVYQGLYGNVSAINNFTVSTALPVKLRSFDARVAGPQVKLEWRTDGEQDIDHYIIERSADGRSFVPVAQQRAAGSGDQPAAYAVSDEAPLPGTSMYRLVLIGKDGSREQLRTVAVNREQKSGITLSPNPMQERASLTFRSADEGAVLSLTSSEGRLMRRISVPAGAGTHQVEIERGNLPGGVYYLELRDSRGRTLAREKLVIE